MERYWDIEYRGKGENAEWMKCLQKSQTIDSYKDSELAFGHVHNIWWIERKDLEETLKRLIRMERLRPATATA